jgi:hypothetical protein
MNNKTEFIPHVMEFEEAGEHCEHRKEKRRNNSKNRAITNSWCPVIFIDGDFYCFFSRIKFKSNDLGTFHAFGTTIFIMGL